MDANQCELLFPHILHSGAKTKPQTGVRDSKGGVLKGRRPSGKRCRPLPNLWHEWNKWMKENENGWGVISGRQRKTSANYYEWKTAAELMKKKKKEVSFFIHHPRIINCSQAFWWGWRKPQDTWLTSHTAEEDSETQRGGELEATTKKKAVLFRDTVLVTVCHGRGKRGETKNRVKRCVKIHYRKIIKSQVEHKFIKYSLFTDHM